MNSNMFPERVRSSIRKMRAVCVYDPEGQVAGFTGNGFEYPAASVGFDPYVVEVEDGGIGLVIRFVPDDGYESDEYETPGWVSIRVMPTVKIG